MPDSEENFTAPQLDAAGDYLGLRPVFNGAATATGSDLILPIPVNRDQTSVPHDKASISCLICISVP
jgi:hypothetical protein